MVRQTVAYGFIPLRGYDTPSIHHRHQYTIARYTIRLVSTPPKYTLLECTWYLVSPWMLSCTTCCVAACDVLIGTCCLSWMLSCVSVRRVVLPRAMCLLIPVPRETNGKGACCCHNTYSSQLPVCQARVRPKSTKGYHPTCVPGIWYLSWVISYVGVRRVVLLRTMC